MYYNLSTTSELDGNWWLPDNPRDAIRGKATFEPFGKARLELDGSLYNPPVSGESKIIHGKTLAGELVTLFDTFLTNWSMQRGADSTQTTHYFNSSYIGYLHLKGSEELFESMSLSFSHLESWFDFNPLHVNYPLPTDRTSTFVEYVPASPFISIVRPLSAKIRFFLNSSPSLSYHDIKLKNSAFITVRPFRKMPLSWFDDVAFRLRQLLTLLVAQPVNFRHIYLCDKLRREEIESKIRYRRYFGSYLFHQMGDSIEDTTRVYPHDIPFSLSTLRGPFEIVLNTWFQKTSPLETMKDIFFVLTLAETTPLDFRFLSILQALEAYDRVLGDNKYLDDAQYQPIKDHLISEIPSIVESSHKESLKSRIWYGNEYSLRKRINNLIGRLPKALKGEFTNYDSKFVAKVIDTRNYLVHRDESSRGNTINGNELYTVTGTLMKMLNFLLLSETGIPSKILHNRISNHNAYKMF